MAKGFHAKTRDEEIKCVDLELNVLMSIEDVTERVNAAVKPDMSPADAQKARRAVMNTIEKESLDKTGLRSDVVTLYQGGQYHLYRYKKYTDVRLVFAPEQDIAFFGGDPDNFEYPRYDLDICFFRVYEDGKPAKIEHYLKWSKAGAGENELVFVAGHPGHTDRLNTVRALGIPARPDVSLIAANRFAAAKCCCSTYSERSLENARRAQGRFVRLSELAARRGWADWPACRIRPSWKPSGRTKKHCARPWPTKSELKDCAKAWDDVVHGHRRHGTASTSTTALLENGTAFNSELFAIARELVRLADEDRPSPTPIGCANIAEADRESLEQQLFSEAPIYADLETAKLADSLSYVHGTGRRRQSIGQANHWPGTSPHARADELVAGTKLADVGVSQAIGRRRPSRPSKAPTIR